MLRKSKILRYSLIAIASGVLVLSFMMVRVVSNRSNGVKSLATDAVSHLLGSNKSAAIKVLSKDDMTRILEFRTAIQGQNTTVEAQIPTFRYIVNGSRRITVNVACFSKNNGSLYLTLMTTTPSKPYVWTITKVSARE
jgi:hypothetical protein